MKNSIDWKKFLILLALGLISVACVFPYVLTIQGDLLTQVGQPIQIIFIAQFIQSTILFAITISLGLFFAKRINFQLPFIDAIIKKDGVKKIFKDILSVSVIAGIAAAAAIYFLDALFTALGAGITTHQGLAPVWQKLLAAVYGGTTEEILMRLFLMTFLIWLGMKIFRKSQPTKTGIVISIIIAAVIFGLGHLPITAAITKINAIVVVRAIVLNGVGGIIFGWLFWKKGLESAMLAHFTADIFLLTLLPLLFK